MNPAKNSGTGLLLRVIILDPFLLFRMKRRKDIIKIQSIMEILSKMDNGQWPLLGAFLIPPVRLVVLIYVLARLPPST